MYVTLLIWDAISVAFCIQKEHISGLQKTSAPKRYVRVQVLTSEV